MIIKKGTLLDVSHERKGKFRGIATSDFDPAKETFYPIALAKGQNVDGMNTKWVAGEDIQCRNIFCMIKVVETRNHYNGEHCQHCKTGYYDYDFSKKMFVCEECKKEAA